MTTIEALEKLSRQHQTGVFPNIVREYFQHLFLSECYKQPEAEKVLFKGGTALRIVYGSPRFSEDLDFSFFGVAEHAIKPFVDDMFIRILAEMERGGIRVELGAKTGATAGGYFGIATFRLFDYPPVGVEINVSARNGRVVAGEVDSVVNNFVPTYSVIHLPTSDIVEEKIFSALLQRKKPRDFYDLYFMLKSRMLSGEQKKRLAAIAEVVIADTRTADFRGELGAFLPADQQTIIRDLPRALADEITRQIAW